MAEFAQGTVRQFLHGQITRRTLMQRFGVLGLSLTAIGAGAAPALGGADVAAAKKEGRLVFWHPDQEPDVVKFVNGFTNKYGIKAEWERLLPGKALPKLDAELKAGTSELDVWWLSDVGIMYDQQKKGRLMQYVSPEMKNYAADFKSNPEGYWTAYSITFQTIMYSTRFVKKEDAPKTWIDLLDPRWKGQVGFQDSTAGSQYAWWYLLRDVVPKDYFDRLAKNQPRAYSSSTQLLDDVQRGELKIGGKVSSFQYVKAAEAKQPVELVLPPEGTPVNNEVVGILASTKRANAARLFVDYFLSQEGQRAWNSIQGSHSARTDVTLEGLPGIASIKLLQPKNIEDYASPARHTEFVKIWNQVTGLK